MSFLTTRVKSPNEDDWGKLRQGLIYLKGTLHMKRYITANNLSNIVWWVYGSFGAFVNITRKHKMNMGSSTELELVSIADVVRHDNVVQVLYGGPGIHN